MQEAGLKHLFGGEVGVGRRPQTLHPAPQFLLKKLPLNVGLHQLLIPAVSSSLGPVRSSLFCKHRRQTVRTCLSAFSVSPSHIQSCCLKKDTVEGFDGTTRTHHAVLSSRCTASQLDLRPVRHDDLSLQPRTGSSSLSDKQNPANPSDREQQIHLLPGSDLKLNVFYSAFLCSGSDQYSG